MRTQKTSGETNKIRQTVGDPKLKMNDFSSLKIQKIQNPSKKIQLYEHNPLCGLKVSAAFQNLTTIGLF